MGYIWIYLTSDVHRGRSLSDYSDEENDNLLKGLLIIFLTMSFPIILLFFSEAHNITFRHIVSKCESRCSIAPLIAYLLTNSLISVVLGSLGQAINLYLYGIKVRELLFISVALLLAITIAMLIPNRFLWKMRLVEDEYMLTDRSFCGDFCRSICEILKLQHIEVTNKLVFLLSTYILAYLIVLQAILVYIMLAIVAVVVKSGIADYKIQRTFQIVGGILWLIFLGPSIYYIV